MLPRDKARFPKKLARLRKLVRRKVTAEAVVAAVANTLARAKFPRLPRLPHGSINLSKTPQVIAFADWLSSMDAKDVGFWLSSAYSHLVPQDKRRKRALFFTPPVLGDRILDDLDSAGLDWTKAKIIDLACGGAAFLAPAALRVAHALTKRGAAADYVFLHIEQHLVGIEIDPFLARLSQFFVGVTLYPWVEATGRAPIIHVAVGDALTTTPPLAGKFDAVICNPPYRKLSRREVNILPKWLRDLCYWQPNLYGMFMALSLSLLNERGIAGLLTPTSFLSGQSFVLLRKHLAEARHVAHIDIVEERLGIFLGVEQDTAISIFAPKPSSASTTNVSVGTAVAGWRTTGSVALDESGAPWILPRSDQDAVLLAAANGRTIAEYGYGAIVGDVVLHRDRRRRFRSLEAARHAKAVKPVPMLRASEIRASGKLEFERDERPDCFIDVATQPRGLITRPVIALQRVSSHDQRRRLVCAPVPRAMQKKYGGILGENHVNFLVATNGSAVPPQLTARILASGPVDRLFRCRSGATNVSAYELAHLPLPDPDVVRAELARGADIDSAVYAGFGLTSNSIDDKKDGEPRTTHRTAPKT
jgi:adenine-specific DNA-methyltransferase